MRLCAALQIRQAASKSPEWAQYVKSARPFVEAQQSKIMLESKPIYEALNMPATAHYKPPAAAAASSSGPAMYELRTYQLHPGYGSVPKLYEAFSKG